MRLRAPTTDDWERHFAGAFDTELARIAHQIEFPRSPEATRNWAETQALAAPENDGFAFAIESLDGELVGATNPHGCDRRHGVFSYGIAVFREHWRKGFASDALRVLLRYYFDELGYHRCWVGVYAFNTASLALHESLGFQIEGRLREQYFSRGKRHDEVLLGITAAEFRRRP